MQLNLWARMRVNTDKTYRPLAKMLRRYFNVEKQILDIQDTQCVCCGTRWRTRLDYFTRLKECPSPDKILKLREEIEKVLVPIEFMREDRETGDISIFNATEFSAAEFDRVMKKALSPTNTGKYEWTII